MFKRLIAALFAMALATAPSIASAQEAPAADAPLIPAGARLLTPVNFRANEDLENILYLDLSNGKRVAIRLKPDWAPNHVARIKELTRAGFYDGIIFHRVIDGFMAQTGDPTGTGTGGSWLPDLKQEFNPMPHVRGSISMARADSEDSANSQFFIVFYPRFALDRKYTNFGRVIAGMDAVDQIERGEPPANPTKILQASIAADRKPQAIPAAVTPGPERQITADMLRSSAPIDELPSATPPTQ